MNDFKIINKIGFDFNLRVKIFWFVVFVIVGCIIEVLMEVFEMDESCVINF